MTLERSDRFTQRRAGPVRQSDRDPRLLAGRVLRGHNIHHRSTVFVQRVDLGRLAGARLGPEISGRFVDRFASAQTPLPNGFFEFLVAMDSAAGAPFEEALLEAIRAVEHAVVLELRRPDTLQFAKVVREPGSRRVVQLVWESHSASFSRGAARAGLTGLVELMTTPSSEVFPKMFEKLKGRARRRQWSPTTAALALAAGRRGIPFEPIAGTHLRLGEGVMQHVVSASSPGFTSGPSVEATFQSNFPAGGSASVPIALVLGTRGTEAVARALDGLLRAAGSAVGLTTRKRTTVSGKPIERTSIGRGDQARFLLGDPRVEAVVVARGPERIVSRGLQLDRLTATAILEPRGGNETDDDRRALEVCVSATTGAFVVSDGHPLAKRLMGEVEAQRIVLLSQGRADSTVPGHLASGGCAVVRSVNGRGQIVTLHRGSETVLSVTIARPQLRSAMYAMALAFGLGLSGVEIIAAFQKRRDLRR